MKSKWVLVMLIVLLVTALTVVLAEAQGPTGQPRAPRTALGTAFTYHGQLRNGGAPVNGMCDFRFGLWDAASGGVQVSDTITLTIPITVTNSLFMASIDFGPIAFDGNARWLAMAVACPPGASYTALTPRQAITPAPMALTLPGLYTQQNGMSPNVIGGYSGNSVAGGVYGATIGGGGASGNTNGVTDNYGTVGGGRNNQAGDNAGTWGDKPYATVSGGANNTATSTRATVGGGGNNVASGSGATVGGGAYNTASGEGAAVGGGGSNTASGIDASVGGGVSNDANGSYSTIGGGESNQANGSHATIGGGYNNNASGEGAFIGGGGWYGITPNGNRADAPASTIGGGLGNVISSTASLATIGGGESNTASDFRATIGGGYRNTASGYNSTVGGGYRNTASNYDSTVGGGNINTASGYGATVGGGNSNTASGYGATVGGGNSNIASGDNATVPGGYLNNATMTYSLAAGYRAKANHQGTLVWADSTNADFASTANNQFLVRANGGVGINTNAPATTLEVVGLNDGADTMAIRGTTTSNRRTGIKLRSTVGNIPTTEFEIGTDSSMDSSHDFFIYDVVNGALRLTIDNAGNVAIPVLGSTGATPLCRNAYNQIASCSSSLRYKSNVANLNLGLETVAQLRPVTFDWTATGEPDLGFVAEQVYEVAPLLTTRNADGQIEGVKYDRMSAVLVKAVQEQQQEIADLKSQVARLTSQIASLQSQDTSPRNSVNVTLDLNVFAFGVLFIAAVMWYRERK